MGTYIKRGHEGGQTPIFRRFPKRGFSNFDFARRFSIVNLSDLNFFDDGAVVDAAALREVGLVPNDSLPVKILGDGELTKKLTIQASWYSKSAHAKIRRRAERRRISRAKRLNSPSPRRNSFRVSR